MSDLPEQAIRPSAVVNPSAAVAAVFDRVADSYDTVGIPWFTPIAVGLVALCSPQPGEYVVDIGCGRGAVLFPVATAVGNAGHVVGIDLSRRMIELVGARVHELGLANVELHVMDAVAPTLEAGRADAVLASLVAFFMPEPLVALRAWATLLRPGGRLAISTFGTRHPAWRDLDGVFTPYLPAQMLDARTSGQVGFFASDEGVEQLLSNAGLVDVATVHADVKVAFPDVGAWSAWTWSHGQRAMWEYVPDSERAAVTSEAEAILTASRGADGVTRLDQQIRYTHGLVG